VSISSLYRSGRKALAGNRSIQEASVPNRIQWEPDLDLALSMARVQEKQVMLEFFNPG
jgi:hypothetical protein